MPPLRAVRQVVAALEQRRLVVAVGGSGLLAALGLVERVGDWDLTTDAPTPLVSESLSGTGLPFRTATVRDGAFGTRERFVVEGGDHEIDVLVGFALSDGDRLVPLPTRVTRRWQGLPIGDPEVWLRAYRLLGRDEKARRLERWLAGSSPAE